MQNVTGCEDTGNVGFQALVDSGTVGDGVDGNTGGLAQLVLGDQAAGQQQGVTLIEFFSAGDGLATVNLCQGDAFHALLALDVHDSVAQLQGDAEVIQTLDDVTLQTAGVGHQFGNDLNLCAFQSHTAGHDQADVTGTQNHALTAGQESFHVDQALCGTGGVDTGGTEAGNIQSTTGTLTAAHSQNNSLGLQLEQTVLTVHGGDNLVSAQIQDHGVQLVGDTQLLHLLDEAAGVFGTGQLFLEGVQTETVMDALVQNAAQFVVALQDQNVLNTCLVGSDSSCQTGGTAADNYEFIFSHGVPLLK